MNFKYKIAAKINKLNEIFKIKIINNRMAEQIQLKKDIQWMPLIQYYHWF